MENSSVAKITCAKKQTPIVIYHTNPMEPIVKLVTPQKKKAQPPRVPSPTPLPVSLEKATTPTLWQIVELTDAIIDAPAASLKWSKHIGTLQQNEHDELEKQTQSKGAIAKQDIIQHIVATKKWSLRTLATRKFQLATLYHMANAPLVYPKY